MDMQTRKYLVIGSVATVLVVMSGLWLFTHGDEPIPVSATAPERVDSAETGPLIKDTPTLTTSSDPDSVHNDHAKDEWIRAIVVELMRQNDGKSVASAALLMLGNPWMFKKENERAPAFRLRMVDLLLKSAALAPTDAPIQTLTLSMCMQKDRGNTRCDLAQQTASLQKLDPSNVLAWLQPLGSARMAGDTATEALALERMAGAARLNLHRSEIDYMVRTAIESARVALPVKYSGTARPIDDLFTNNAASVPVVDLSSISQACGRHTTDSRAHHCGRIAQALLVEDNLFVRRAAWSIASQLPSNSAYDAQIDYAKRNLRRASWQSRQANAIQKSEETINNINSGDVRALEGLLVQNGVALEPPESWNP